VLTLRSIPLNWQALALLYEGLIQLSPTLGALVSHAAAIAEAQGLEYGLTRLDAIPMESIKSYQPYWALKAHLLKQLGLETESQQAYVRAIGLTEDSALREFLLNKSKTE
jgi:RNA polymerase sigma-70 factor (ECF subfamily)